MLELKEESAGTAVTLGVGERVRVLLREAGGTGYRWQAGQGCVAVMHLDRDQTGKTNGRPGASVRRTWMYTALEEGTCDLRFELVRSWEKTATGKTISFPVTVHRVN